MRRHLVLVAAAILFAAGCARPPDPRAAAQTAPPRPAPSPDRNVELVIYQDDFALINEQRAVTVPAGLATLPVDRISRLLDPDSLLCDFRGEEPPAVLSSSYAPPVEFGFAVLRAHLGKPVELVRYDEQQREVSRRKGTLVGIGPDDGPIVDIDGRLVIDPPGSLELAEAAGTAGGQLSLCAEAKRAGPASLGLSYLTRGMGWDTIYTATLVDGDEEKMDLWVDAMVRNDTQVTYPASRLAFIVGSPSVAVSSGMARQRRRFESEYRAQRLGGPARYKAADGESDAAASPMAEGRWSVEGVVQNALNNPLVAGVQYGFRVERAAEIPAGKLTRVRLLDGRGIPCRLDFAVDLPVPGYGSAPKNVMRRPVTLGIQFQNAANGGLGTTLPGGPIRVYARNDQGSRRYLGADDVPALAVDDWGRLTVADASGVVCDWQVARLEPVARGKQRLTVEVALRSQRSVATNVRLVQRFPRSGAALISASDSYAKQPDGRYEWRVAVPAQGKKTLSYVVDVRDPYASRR